MKNIVRWEKILGIISTKIATFVSKLSKQTTWSEYFHVVLRYLVKRSLKVDNLDVYKEIDHLYLTVNSVRHAGRCEYKGGKGEVIGVGSKEVREMINAARSAIEWASSLQNES